MNIPFLHKKINLLDRFDKYFFFSPHFDDAVLSCGNLLHYLASKNKYVEVMTIFTKASQAYPTPQSTKFTKMCGYDNPIKLFRDRKTEDIDSLSYLNVNYKHLNFVDAAWRVGQNDQAIYKSSKTQFEGKISTKDQDLLDQVLTTLSKIKKGKKTVFFGPLGIGGHVDHIITRDVLLEIDRETFFWADFPYIRNTRTKKDFFKKNSEFKEVNLEFQSEKLKKINAIKFYKSQIKSLYQGQKITNWKEEYFKIK